MRWLTTPAPEGDATVSGIFDAPRRLTTGVEALDRNLDGGLLPGSIVAFVSPPGSQSEQLLYELCAVRDTLYLTTDRTEQVIADTLQQTPMPTGDPDIRYVPGDAPLEKASFAFHDVHHGMNLIIDPVDNLELAADRPQYQHFLNHLQNQMHNTDSIGVLHCLDGEHTPPLRDVTLHMADTVFDFDVSVRGTDVETRLAVKKFRGGTAPRETLKLEFGYRVRVDTSRDIA